MKIALVSPYDYPYPGGVTQHISHLAAEFTRLGHEVRIIAPSSTAQEDMPPSNVYKVGSVVPIPANGSVARITLSLRLSGRVKRIMEEEKFDIIHIHEPLIPALPITVLRHSHSVTIGTFHAQYGNQLAYFSAKRVLKRWVKNLNGRIAVSEAAKRMVARFFPGEYAIIPNGVDVERFGDDVQPIPELRDGRLNILFVGRLEKRKGFKYLLRAYIRVRQELPQVRLLVAGAYSEKAKVRYQAIVEKARIPDVHFVGFLSSSDLARYYKSCDVFCAPSTGGESFGIVLLEAMAARKAIVATSIEGYRGVLDHGIQGLLVPAKDDAALAWALKVLLKDNGLREQMGQAGWEKAQDYCWPKVARRVLDYYQQVIEQCIARAEQPVQRGRRLRTILANALTFRQD